MSGCVHCGARDCDGCGDEERPEGPTPQDSYVLGGRRTETETARRKVDITISYGSPDDDEHAAVRGIVEDMVDSIMAVLSNLHHHGVLLDDPFIFQAWGEEASESDAEEIDSRLADGWVPEGRPVEEIVADLRSKFS